MKMKSKFSIVLTILALLALAPPVRADIYSYIAYPMTNSVLSSTNGPFYANGTTNLTTLAATPAYLAVNSDPLGVRDDAGLALLPQFGCNNSGTTAQVTNFFDYGVIVNGATNWTTTHPLKTISTQNSSNLVVDCFVVDKATLNNVAFIRWTGVGISYTAGQTNVFTIYPVVQSHSTYAH
jgi:hypothetical protein